MSTLREFYRWLDQAQRRRGVRITATVLALLMCGLFFGSVLSTTYSLERQRRLVTDALTGQKFDAGDPYAVSLYESGTIEVDGRVYGGEFFLQNRHLLFDQTSEIQAPAALASALVHRSNESNAPLWLVDHPETTWMLATLAVAWFLLIIWMSVVVQALVAIGASALGVGVVALFGAGEQVMWGVMGIGLLTFTFVLLSRAAQLILDGPNQVFAVAHTVLKEASRSKISLVFIICLLVLLPTIPLFLDPDAPLRFRIQTFISNSLRLTFGLAAFMTLFLSCATVAFEIRDKQIWQIVTKPVSRFGYLLGKWLGVVTINLIILIIASVSIFSFVQFLREQPVRGGLEGVEDRMEVRDSVLTARVGMKPAYETLNEEQLRARIDQVIRNEYGTLEDVPLSLRLQIREKLEEEHLLRQRVVPPGQGERTYVFEGLQDARERGSSLTLRYRFHILRDDEHETFTAIFYFNGDTETAARREYVPTMSHVLRLPSRLIREDGTLTVSVVNMFQPSRLRPTLGWINFEVDDFELLYEVGTFQANFVRAMLVDWLKLAFLAMLGICCATFMSFPVACLTSFTVFIGGTCGPFLATSLEEYYPPEIASVDWSNIGLVIQWAFQSMIRLIAQGIVFLLAGFGEIRPAQSLVEGRLISWNTVFMAIGKIGLLWTGLTLLMGYVVMRHRQIAIYSGQG